MARLRETLFRGCGAKGEEELHLMRLEFSYK